MINNKNPIGFLLQKEKKIKIYWISATETTTFQITSKNG
jgi:hypothetical protein